MPKTKALHRVEMHRWDDVYGEWDHEATFRLFWRARAAAEALTAGNHEVYRLTDARIGEAFTFYYSRGQEVEAPADLSRVCV